MRGVTALTLLALALVSCGGDDSPTGSIPVPTTTTTTTLPPLWSKAGTGDTVFDMPRHVARCRIVGIYTGYSSNFIVHLNGHGLVNELLGTGWGTTKYDGTVLTTGGGVVDIVHSSGVAWTFTEVR